MLSLFATAFLTLSTPPVTCATASGGPAQEEQEQAAKRIEAALADLKEAFKEKDPLLRIAAIDRNAEVASKETAEFFARAVKDDDDRVKESALSALRFMEHPEALKELLAIYKRDRKLQKHRELFPKLIKAIGQHGSESAIQILGPDLVDHKNRDAVKAGLMGLGRIRSNEAVETLINLMNTSSRAHVQSYMRHFRMALMVLTETDQGQSQDDWIRWWNKNKKTFEVKEKEPKLPAKENREWKDFWGEDYEVGREKRRKKRGEDPEQGSELRR